tara:strand:- start:55 stop:2085 length:2031 start_codon:yes stop_codon:yes gene_type:complete
MTATERFYSGSKDDIVSMDDTDVYGDIFAQMSFKEAIDLELLTDYKIITIDIKKSEISEFIKDNGLVELNNVWKKETEARSLASMLALRKAMKLFPIKNAVSFHSSIEKAKRNKELHTHITANYGYDPIDTYTVSGKDKTSKRNDIIQEFASSEKALITNARCLTEGVDIPNIDCIVFADPKKSKVDIVQALGRALRKKDGKDWGYVILPVIYDEKTNEIDNENFNDILSIVRGLAANDERIVEYFKDKSLPKGGKKGGGVEVFSIISETLSESDFAEQLNIRIWEKLSKFNWMPFEEARALVRTFKFKNQNDWRDFCKKGNRPNSIPSSPSRVYKNEGWLSFGDWIGTTAGWAGDYKSFEEAREYVQKLGLKNVKEWYKFNNSKKRPVDIPVNPQRMYKEEFINWGDWLGALDIRDRNIEYMSYEKASKFVQTLKIKTHKEWKEYCKSDKKPKELPVNPERVYKGDGWKGFKLFIGERLIEYVSYNEAQKYVKTLGLKTMIEWMGYVKSGKLPEFIPSNPQYHYKNKGWTHGGDWLGTGKTPDSMRSYRSFKEARKYVRALNLKSQKEWAEYAREDGDKPDDIPSKPSRTYKNKGWAGLKDFLGYNAQRKAWSNVKDYVSFSDAKIFAKKMNIKTQKEWFNFAKSGGEKPENIPYKPHTAYKSEWKNWADFLGKE